MKSISKSSMAEGSGQIKKKVQVWLYCRTPDSVQFLLLKTRPERGEFWQPVTGSVEEGESVEAAALREAQEESGISNLNLPQSVGVPFEFESRGHTVREYAFSISIPSHEEQTPIIRLDPHEHIESRWVGARAALEMVRFSSNAEILRSLLVQLKLQLE